MRKLIIFLFVIPFSLNSQSTEKQSDIDYFKRAYEKAENKNYYGAIIDYTQAIALDPNSSAAYHNRALSKEGLNDQLGAIKDYTKAIQLKPDNDGAYFNRSILKSQLNDNFGAIADLTKIIELLPNNTRAYLFRGIIKHDSGDKYGAIADYTKIIEFDPDNFEAYYERGISKYSGDKYGACADWKICAKLGSTKAARWISKYCKPIISTDDSSGVAIGDFRDGGVVFWIDPVDDKHGLVCALMDYSIAVSWGCLGIDLPNVPNTKRKGKSPFGLGAEIGDGLNNTNNIIKDCLSAPAAMAARSLGPEWFLPSINELNQMYLNKVVINATAVNNGGMEFTDNTYWSSSEDSGYTAWIRHFNEIRKDSVTVRTIIGNQYRTFKTDVRNVRAVKGF